MAKTQDEVLDGWVSVGKDAVNAVGDAKNTKVDTSGEETTVTTLTGQIDATKKNWKRKILRPKKKRSWNSSLNSCSSRRRT